MASKWASLGFSDTEMRSARQAASEFLGDNPPVWRDQGYDLKQKLFEDYLQYLRQSQNSIIADKMAKLEDKKPIFELLRNKIKYIRSIRGKNGNSILPSETPKQQTIANSGSGEDGQEGQETEEERIQLGLRGWLGVVGRWM